MKKIYTCMCIFALSLIFSFGSAFAQSYHTDKGSKIIAGEFSFSSGGGDLYENSDGDRLTTIEMDTFISYFLTPGLALGANFLLIKTAQGDLSATAWGIGPRLMYFIGGNKSISTGKGKIYPFLDAAFLYIKSTSKGASYELSSSRTRIKFGGGILHMLSESVGLFGEAAYNIDSEKPEDGDSERGNQFNIVAGLAFFLY